MNLKTISNFAAPYIVLTLLLVNCGGLEKSSETKKGSPQLADELKGAWLYVSKKGEEPGGDITGNRIKFLADKHWNITQSDPNTGVTVFHHGGTYKLNGDEYSETITYANPNTGSMIGQNFTFKMEVKGDTLIQTGVGNDFNEVWKRAD